MKYATIKEAAEHFGVTTKTIRNWISAGVISADRVGPKLIRVDISSVQTTPLGSVEFESAPVSTTPGFESRLRMGQDAPEFLEKFLSGLTDNPDTPHYENE